MESEPIISLRCAIEQLALELRAMRGVWTSRISNEVHSDISIVTAESNDRDRSVSSQLIIDHGSTTLNDSFAVADAELIKDPESVQKELDRLFLVLGEKNKELQATRHALTATEQAVGDLEEQKAQLTTEVEAFERTMEQFQILQQERSAVEEHLRAMKSEEVNLEAKSRLLASREDELGIGLEQVKDAGELLRKLWPEWLCGEDLRHWKELIEKDVFSANSPPSFSLLFAAIHNYNASLRDPDNRILLDALRDLGRRLYQWLKDLGKSEESTAEVAEAWAASINAECEERCAIQVAVPGNPANNKWMSFTPRSGSAPDVASVRSWCVSDNQGRPIHRAEVAV